MLWLSWRFFIKPCIYIINCNYNDDDGTGKARVHPDKNPNDPDAGKLRNFVA